MEMVHATMTSTAATLRFISLQFFQFGDTLFRIPIRTAFALSSSFSSLISFGAEHVRILHVSMKLRNIFSLVIGLLMNGWVGGWAIGADVIAFYLVVEWMNGRINRKHGK